MSWSPINSDSVQIQPNRPMHAICLFITRLGWMLDSDWSMSGLLFLNNRPLRSTTDRSLIKASEHQLCQSPLNAKLGFYAVSDMTAMQTNTPRHLQLNVVPKNVFLKAFEARNRRCRTEMCFYLFSHFGTSLYCPRLFPSAALAREKSDSAAMEYIFHYHEQGSVY